MMLIFLRIVASHILYESAALPGAIARCFRAGRLYDTFAL
jgi:hypothetical protein